METISALVMMISVFFTGFFTPDQPSVEIGISSLSPAGIAGGYAVPASGCSDLHDNDCAAPTITADAEVVRKGDSVTVCWNPDNHTSCTLSGNLTGDPNILMCDTVTVENKSIFAIACTDGLYGESQVAVEVIPTFQEI
jgi:hypothetical protein